MPNKINEKFTVKERSVLLSNLVC